MTSRRAKNGPPARIDGTVYQLHLDPSFFIRKTW